MVPRSCGSDHISRDTGAAACGRNPQGGALDWASGSRCLEVVGHLAAQMAFALLQSQRPTSLTVLCFFFAGTAYVTRLGDDIFWKTKGPEPEGLGSCL